MEKPIKITIAYPEDIDIGKFAKEIKEHRARRREILRAFPSIQKLEFEIKSARSKQESERTIRNVYFRYFQTMLNEKVPIQSQEALEKLCNERETLKLLVEDLTREIRMLEKSKEARKLVLMVAPYLRASIIYPAENPMAWSQPKGIEIWVSENANLCWRCLRKNKEFQFPDRVLGYIANQASTILRQIRSERLEEFESALHNWRSPILSFVALNCKIKGKPCEFAQRENSCLLNFGFKSDKFREFSYKLGKEPTIVRGERI